MATRCQPGGWGAPAGPFRALITRRDFMYCHEKDGGGRGQHKCNHRPPGTGDSWYITGPRLQAHKHPGVCKLLWNHPEALTLSCHKCYLTSINNDAGSATSLSGSGYPH